MDPAVSLGCRIQEHGAEELTCQLPKLPTGLYDIRPRVDGFGYMKPFGVPFLAKLRLRAASSYCQHPRNPLHLQSFDRITGGRSSVTITTSLLL